jgi:hypothetical protein
VLSRGERRRRRRDRRQRQQKNPQQQFQVKLTQEEQRRLTERREYIDAAVSYLSNYSWSYFVTLTFRESLGSEAIERGIKRFTRFVHENVFGEFDEVRDVRDLYGVRYFPSIERGMHGQKRLHAHVLICGGEVLGERLANARWTPWRKWWNREYGGLVVEKPESQGDVAAYCTKYILKGDESGFELRSTWADERDRRKRAEAPLLEERKVGIDVTRSAELERTAFRGEAPHGCGPTSTGSGKVCFRCGLVSLCRCWTGTTESGQVVDAPESDAGACESGVTNKSVGEQFRRAAPLSPQMELRMQQQLALDLEQASASKSVNLRFSSRREKKLHRWREWKLRTRQVPSSSAACNVPRSN